jgi:diguanylate cyclase (GGDEF)-like protein
MSLVVLYTKQKNHEELISHGLTLTSMVSNYSETELQSENANKLLEIVKYTGSHSGLIYSIIMDTNQQMIAHTDSRYVDNTLIAKRAASSNNSLQQMYTDSRTNYTIYEFSRTIYKSGNKLGIVRLGFAPDINPLFSVSEIRVLLLVVTLFFSLVPIFYYLLRHFMQLHALSITDELTGLYNRRGFFTLAQDCLQLAKRSQKGVMLLYADLDNMKETNDTLGHEKGDRLIQETAAILKSTYRTSDIIARIGGDEFVVFPVGTDEDHSATIANRLQENIDKFNAQAKNRYTLRISTGVATYDPHSVQSIDELLNQADSLMYQNKERKKKGHTGSGLHVKRDPCPG